MVAPMHADLVRELEAYRKLRGFDVAAWVEKKTDMFAEYLRKSRLSGAVISVSGGVDSAVRRRRLFFFFFFFFVFFKIF
jgi:hypothetical protein